MLIQLKALIKYNKPAEEYDLRNLEAVYNQKQDVQEAAHKRFDSITATTTVKGPTLERTPQGKV